MKGKLSVLALGVSMVLMVSACGSNAVEPEKPVPPVQTVQNVQDVQNEEVVKAEATDDLAPVVEQTSMVEVEPVVNVEPVSEAEPEATPQEIYTFTDCNETVYATSSVNLRSGPGTEYDKVGSMGTGESVTRTGIGTGDYSSWSRVMLNDGSIVYVSSNYISTSKPEIQQVTKPSTGTTASTTPSGGSGTEGVIYSSNPNSGIQSFEGGSSVANEAVEGAYSGTIG